MTADLWTACKQGCPHAREQLILAHQPYVGLTVKRALPRCPVAIDPEDLWSEGMIALIRAVDRYDPDRGVQFTSYAITCIRGAVLEWLRHEDWVPRKVREAQKQGGSVIELASLEELFYPDENEDEWRPWARPILLADPSPGPEELLLMAEEAQETWALIDRLPEIDRWALRERYGQGRHLHEIGDMAGMSDSWADLHLRSSIAAIREELSITVEEEPRSRHDWSEEEDERLMALWPDHTAAQLAAITSRTAASLRSRRRRLLENERRRRKQCETARPAESRPAASPRSATGDSAACSIGQR